MIPELKLVQENKIAVKYKKSVKCLKVSCKKFSAKKVGKVKQYD